MFAVIGLFIQRRIQLQIQIAVLDIVQPFVYIVGEILVEIKGQRALVRCAGGGGYRRFPQSQPGILCHQHGADYQRNHHHQRHSAQEGLPHLLFLPLAGFFGRGQLGLLAHRTNSFLPSEYQNVQS